MADVRSPIPVCGLLWELLCVLLRMRVMCSEIAGNDPGQGDRDWERSRPNQMAAIICASGQRRFVELFLLKLMKWAVKLVLK